MAEEDLIEERIENQRRKGMVRWVMDSTEHINQKVFPFLNWKDATRRQVRDILFDDKKLAGLVPVLGIYREIDEIHDRFKDNPLAFINEIKKRREIIKIADAELADKVGAIHFDEKTASYLNNIYYSVLMPINDVSLFLRDIYPRLYREFSSLEDKQLLNKMDELFRKKMEEISYLRRYSIEVANWNNLPEPKHVEYYAQRIGFFMYGGYENYEGIVRKFDDRDVLEAIKKKNVIKQLLNYSLERKFIADRIREIRMGLQENNWADFFNFFRNVKKHAKDLVVRFGNIDFAKRILKDKKKFRKDPQSWLAALQEMEAQLSNRYYFEKDVLKPATNELVAIFNEYAEKREKDLAKSLKEFKDYMKGIVNAIGKAPEKKAGEIIKHVSRKKAKIMIKWKRMRVNFENKEIKLLQHMLNLDNLRSEINEKNPDPKKHLQKVNAIEERQEQWKKYFLDKVERINVRGTGNLPAAIELLSLPPIMGGHDEIVRRKDDRLEEKMITTFSKNLPMIMEEAGRANEELEGVNGFIGKTGLAGLIVMKERAKNVIPIPEEPTGVLSREA